MKACPRLRFKRERQSGGGIEGFMITARTTDADDDREVGVIIVRKSRRDAYVSWNWTRPELQRCGLATKLHEMAARWVCSTYGTPLASDTERSLPTQRFWEKQVAKGRATCVEPEIDARDHPPKPEEATYGRGDCAYYQLKSCAVRDLSGRQRRR